jgi:hypothetical protein
MSDLSLLCAPKRTSAVPLLWVHALDQLAFARVGVGQLFNLAHRLFRCWSSGLTGKEVKRAPISLPPITFATVTKIWSLSLPARAGEG